MAYSDRHSLRIHKIFQSNEDAPDFYEENCSSTRCFDDLQIIRIKQNYSRHINLRDNPRLSYLNLLDYEDKIGNFQSSAMGRMYLDMRPTDFGSRLRRYEEFTCGSIFCFFVEYLKNMPKDSLDLRALDRKICHVVKKLNHCTKSCRRSIFNAIMELYNVPPTEKVTFPMVLKHLCSFEEILTYIARRILMSSNTEFFKEFVDECVDSRSNFLTMWKRNFIVNDIPCCPMTYAYLHGKLDLLSLLLDYGFHQNDHRTLTLEILLYRQSHHYRIPWLKHFIYPTDQNSRSSVALEVIIFIIAFLEPSSKSPGVLVKCFQLAWNARKDPYVSRRELARAFENYIKVKEDVYGCSKLEQMIFRFYRRLNDFQTLLPDCQPKVPQPRSLQHLCRCTIRESLNDNLELPRGVTRLPIPNKMKSYILLK